MTAQEAVRNRILQLCGKSQNPKLLTIKLICDGLGITLSEFFDTSDFTMLESELQ